MPTLREESLKSYCDNKMDGYSSEWNDHQTDDNFVNSVS